MGPDDTGSAAASDVDPKLIRKVNWAAELFEEIGYLMNVDRTHFDDFFYSSNPSELHLNEAKKRILGLGVSESEN